MTWHYTVSFMFFFAWCFIYIPFVRCVYFLFDSLSLLMDSSVLNATESTRIWLNTSTSDSISPEVSEKCVFVSALFFISSSISQMKWDSFLSYTQSDCWFYSSFAYPSSFAPSHKLWNRLEYLARLLLFIQKILVLLEALLPRNLSKIKFKMWN